MLLKGEGEVKLNPEVLKELEMNSSLGTPKAVTDKSWMDFERPADGTYRHGILGCSYGTDFRPAWGSHFEIRRL